IMASGNDVCPAIVFSGRLSNRPGDFVYLETVAGGSGALNDMDGMDGVHVHMTNSSNLPVEALENEYPLRVECYALVPDSGGVGRQRGGMAVAREVRALADGIVFSARSDNHVVGRASGVLGGGDGRQARLVYKRTDGSEEVMSSKTAGLRMAQGESVCLETSGAGGFGSPQERAMAALADDVYDERVSLAAARQAYGERVDQALSSKA